MPKIAIVDSYLEKNKQDEGSANTIRNSLNKIQSIHKKLLNKRYLKEDILKLKNSSDLVSLTLKNIRENNLWGYKERSKIEFTLNDFAETWKKVATLQKVIAVIMEKGAK